MVKKAATEVVNAINYSMSTFKIEGGHKLNGTITPQGAKNEVLQILCAVLLTPEKIKIGRASCRERV